VKATPRIEPAALAGVRDMLEAWLDYHRTTLWNKCAGLTDEQPKLRPAPPSALSLLGLLRHMTDAERDWFERDLLGTDMSLVYSSQDDWDADFKELNSDPVEEVFRRFEEECARSRANLGRYSLDDVASRRRPNGEPVSVRWIVVHMLEESAWHNGHADLLRERIDGLTGD
jgi:uncharacterized damage-inducible protein DinB